MDGPRVDIEQALSAARRAADAAARASMPFFLADPEVEWKEDASPVTEADRKAEAAILDVLRALFPDHDILTEESGAHERGSPYRWIVDPLDGTRGFARGTSFWGPLIALEHRGEVLAGVLELPAIGDVYYAGKGLGCYRNGMRLGVSRVEDWTEATLSLGELSRLLAPPYRDGIVALARGAASARAYGDLAAATLLLDGRAEAWIEAGVRIWDLAPMRILVPEAGGRVTNLAGGDDLEAGAVVATNGRVHDHVLAAFR